MGTWGVGSFENDTAMDWANGLVSADDVIKVFDSLPPNDGLTQLDADQASLVVAAAEAVATIMGRVAQDVPQDLQDKLAGTSSSDDLIITAQDCLSRVMSGSELLDLWAEQDETKEDFARSITGLVKRLNPDMSWDRPSKEEIEELAGPIGQCVFCDQGLMEGDMFYLGFRDFTSRSGLFSERGVYCHIECLNAKLHPRHMMQAWQFDLR